MQTIFTKNTLYIFLFSFFCVMRVLSLDGITVDLREPTFSEGVLKTEKGGVITAPNIRIQAKKISYARQEDEEGVCASLEAEEDLIVEFGDYIFVGRRLEYDLEAKKGVLFCGRTAIEPWFFGGEEIHLCPDGSYIIYNGYATTSEDQQAEWQLDTEKAHLANHCMLSAANVKFRFFSLPLFWMPRIRLNLDSIFNSPFRYTVRFGGTQGPRVGVSYDVFNWRGLKTRLRLDYRLERGLGGGLEFNYKSPNHLERFHGINYIAEDTTLYNRKKRTRYRYLGNYSNVLDGGKTTIHGSYDKLSDKEMATDYEDRGLLLDTAKRTEIEIRRQECDWILDLLGRFRVNDFQTLKQELPTLSGSLKPFVLGNSGIISDNRFKLSYLELEFSDDRPGPDFNSPRYDLSHNLYRPFKWRWLTITPEAGVEAIYYGNNSNRYDRWMTIGLFGMDVNTDLYRFYGNCKHAISPYLRYRYYTWPTTSPDDHFIFDIEDGWFRLNMLTAGLTSNLYTKESGGCIYRKLYADFYIHSFFDTDTLPFSIPKTYARIVYNTTPYMRNTLNAAWDNQRNMLDHWNYRLEWTIHTNAAIAVEYRHRSPYDWRKADHTNFILDSFQPIDELRDSTLSDKRDTILLHGFYRFHPNWAFELQSRNGWNRSRESDYNEFQFNILGTLQSSLHLRISYRHRQFDDRFSFNLSVGLNRPEPNYCAPPCIEF